MTITFTPFVQDGSANRWTIPKDARQDPETFEVNCSNANAIDLFLALGWDCDPANSDPLPIEGRQQPAQGRRRYRGNHLLPAGRRVVA